MVKGKNRCGAVRVAEPKSCDSCGLDNCKDLDLRLCNGVDGEWFFWVVKK